MSEWTEKDDSQLVEMRQRGESWKQIAMLFNCSAAAARSRWQRIAVNPDEESAPGKTEDTTTGDTRSLSYLGTRLETVEQLLESAGVDLNIWQVVEKKLNSWEVSGKRKTGCAENPEEIWKTTNRQITVKLTRLAPAPIQEGIKLLLSGVSPITTAVPRKPAKTSQHLAEIGLYDHHFGKLCWGEETGHSYDLKIAERQWQDATNAMLSRVAQYNVSQIVLPLGNDFFHVNDFHNQTSNFTRVESVDDRFSKVFRIGCRAAQYAVERCLELAPVKILFVPGNHDRHTAWFMTEWLAAVFQGNKHVEIDNGPRERKYIAYGKSLIGYVHGDELKHDLLPQLMATEVPQLWAGSEFRTWHIGHWHKRKEVRYTVGDTLGGVEVRTLPSLCGTDAWHYRHGFTGNHRMSEVNLWSKTDGPVGHYVTHAKA